MTEMELLRRVLTLPELYAGAKSGTAVMAFLSGYALARNDLGKPVDAWGEVFERVRLALDPKMRPENAHTVGMVLERVSGGDDKLAFDMLYREMMKVVDEMDGGRREGSGAA